MIVGGGRSGGLLVFGVVGGGCIAVGVQDVIMYTGYCNSVQTLYRHHINHTWSITLLFLLPSRSPECPFHLQHATLSDS